MYSKTILLFYAFILSFHRTYGIINGKDASSSDIPYLVQIENSNDEFVCGGSVISENWVLTTHFCVKWESENYTIRSNTDWKQKDGRIRKVDSKVLHKGYRIDKGVPVNNIALLHVEEAFEFKIEPSNSTVGPGVMTTVSGFGRTLRKSSPRRMQSVEVPVIDMEPCKKAFGLRYLPEGMFCAGYADLIDKNACWEDEGGPMVVDGRLVGVVSYVRDCFESPFVAPVLYTDVVYYGSWIRNNTKM